MRALLIEDSIEIRKAIIPALRELAGVEVVAFAEDAQGGVYLSTQQPCDMVILDLFLKTGSGLDVLSKVRETDPHFPVIVLTNYATEDVRKRCLNAGATAVYDKSTETDAFFEHCIALADRLQLRHKTMLEALAV